MVPRLTSEWHLKVAQYALDGVRKTLAQVEEHVPKRSRAMKSAVVRGTFGFVMEKLGAAEAKARVEATEEAIKTFKREFKDDLLRDIEIALSHLDRAKTLEAQAQTEVSVHLPPLYADAHLLASEIFNLAEDYKSSLARAEMAVRARPDEIFAWDMYVIALYNEGKRKEALEAANKGVEAGLNELRASASLAEERKASILASAMSIAAEVERHDRERAPSLYDKIAETVPLEESGLAAALASERLRYKK